MSEHVQIKVVISGRVQGVFFRQETCKTALGFNLKGYVKNLANGSVEAVFQGKKSDVEKAIQWCHIGPALSVVNSVIKEEQQPLSDYSRFEVRY